MEVSSENEPAKKGHHPPKGSAREELLHQAHLSLLANTFDSDPLSTLAKRARVSQPLFHYHFKSREDLWQAAVNQAFTPLSEAFRQAEAEFKGLGPRPRFELLLRRFIYFVAARPVVAAIIVTESMHGGHRLRWLAEEHLGPIHRCFDDLYRAGVKQGVFVDLGEMHVTQTLMAAVTHFFAAQPLAKLLYGTEAVNQAGDYAEVLVEVLLKGTAKPPAGGLVS